MPQGRLAEVRHSCEAPPIKASAWSPDCSLLALFSWNELHVARLPDGDPAWRVVRADDELRGTTQWFAWAPDGRRAAEASGRTLRIRAAEDGTVLDEWDTGVEAGGVFWSPDGELVAVTVSDAGRGSERGDHRVAGRRPHDAAPPACPLGCRGDRLARRQHLLRLAVAVQRRVDR
ncbi:hypothetical protein [Streptomyces sp. NPDC001450]